ncbi:hypothetical protein ABK040_011126 [Willaertia magna]
MSENQQECIHDKNIKVILLGGEIGSGKSSLLSLLYYKLLFNNQRRKNTKIFGFIQPAIYENKKMDENATNTTEESNVGSHDEQVLQERQRKEIVIQFLEGNLSSQPTQTTSEPVQFTLAKLNPEFSKKDLEQQEKIIEQNLHAKKPKTARWIFDESVFEKIDRMCENEFNLNENRNKIIIVDELGWMELDGKGHWPTVSKLFKKSKEGDVWIFAVRNTLTEEYESILKSLITSEKQVICKKYILQRPHPQLQNKAINFDETLNDILDISTFGYTTESIKNI